ncbi:MAG: Heimdall-CTERM domain-containing surface protein [Candidatus Hodarchaeota archaeon]
MRKKIIMGITVIFLLTVLTFTSPAQAADYAGYSFSEDYFAIEVDLYPDPTDPDLIHDLLDDSAETGDTNEFEDIQFYMAYMNKSGIEVAFSALEKMEHDLKFGDLLDSSVETVLRAIPNPDIETALDTTIFHINATAPFQQLVQHFTTPWMDDVFVTNNFMCLIAYSSSPDDPTLDIGDELYIGYTFSIQELIDAVNDVLVANGHSDDQIGHFNYEASFEPTSTGYRFGIEYTNMFVLWQRIDIKPRGIDIFDAAGQYIKTETNGIVFGQDIAAASVLDHIGFEYEFTTQEITGANQYILGSVETNYNIGETNFLVTKDNQDFLDGITNWNHTPFIAAPSYTFEIPDNLKGYSVPGFPISVPSSVTINLNDLAFYLDDDAKARIHMQNGFGLTVATATTTFGVSIEDPEDVSYEDKTGTDKVIDLQMGGNTFFHTDFVGKDTYKLLGLQDLLGIDPTVDRPVYIIPFIPTGWAIHNYAKEYFAVEFALAFGFTRFIAQELTPQYFDIPAGTAEVYVTTVLYFTFTEFPEWYGGEILHDPAYSAVAAMAGFVSSDTEGPPDTGTGIPGFEFLSAILAIPPLYALYRKRRH